MGAVSASTPMKPYSSSCANVNRPHTGEANCANELRLSIRWPTLGVGRDDEHAMWGFARTFLICAGALSFTICMFWLGLNSFLVNFSERRELLDRCSRI